MQSDLKKITIVLSDKDLKRAAEIDGVKTGEKPNQSRFLRKLIRKYIKDSEENIKEM